MLSQGEVGKDLLIAYASRNFNRAEKNYNVVKKEMATIVWGIKHFRLYLCGRKFVKDPGLRLWRWHILLEEYHCEIVYRPGMQNSNLEALSRVGALAKECNKFVEIYPDVKVKILQENHDLILSGHCCMNKTYQAIKRFCQWLNMKKR